MTQITISQRFARAAAVGAAGFAVALAIMVSDRAFQTDYSFLRVATAGAFLSGLMFAGTFGGKGAWGWFRSGLGFGFATIVGAILAVMMLPFDIALMRISVFDDLRGLPSGSLMGPLYVVSMIIENLWVAAAWIGAYSGIHALVMRNEAVSP